MNNYVTRDELLEILAPMQDCLVKNTASAKNITVSMMALFKCIENMEYSSDFKTSMYDVLQSVEESLDTHNEIHEVTLLALKKIKDSGQ